MTFYAIHIYENGRLHYRFTFGGGWNPQRRIARSEAEFKAELHHVRHWINRPERTVRFFKITV